MTENTTPTDVPLPPTAESAQVPAAPFAAPVDPAAPAAPYGSDPTPYSVGQVPTGPESQKSFVATWLFAWLLGVWGVDRFYLGKVGTGLLKLFTIGGLGVWWLVDLILVLTGTQRDKQGLKLAGFDQHKKVAWIVTGAAIVLSSITSGINASNGASPATNDAPAVSAPVAEAPAEAEAEVEAEPSVETATVQSWADENFGAFAAETFTGTGDNLLTLPAGAIVGISTASHDGSSNFSVSVLDAANQSTGDLLVNTIGAYSGSSTFGINSFGEAKTLQVTADGNWTITISPISAAPAFVGAGVGDAVMLYDGGAAKLTATHAGASNFSLVEETNAMFSMGLLINEIGAYSGAVPLSAGPSVLTLSADGAWTLVLG